MFSKHNGGLYSMKEIPDFPGYFADRDGNIYSLRHKKDNNHYLLSGSINMYGYLQYGLYDERSKLHSIVGHKIILSVFVGPRPINMQIRHLNGIKIDNRLCNLCYGTRQENAQDAIKFGEMPRGEQHKNSKLSSKQVRYIKKSLKNGVKVKLLAEIMEVSDSTIRQIRANKIWKHIQ